MVFFFLDCLTLNLLKPNVYIMCWPLKTNMPICWQPVRSCTPGGVGVWYSHIFAKRVCAVKKPPFFDLTSSKRPHFLKIISCKRPYFYRNVALHYFPIQADRPRFSKSPWFVTLSGFDPGFFFVQSLQVHLREIPARCCLFSIGEMERQCKHNLESW